MRDDALLQMPPFTLSTQLNQVRVMKTFAISVATLLLLASAAYGQDDFYYYSDERQIPLEKAEHWTVIQLPQGAQSTRSGAGRIL